MVKKLRRNNKRTNNNYKKGNNTKNNDNSVKCININKNDLLIKKYLQFMNKIMHNTNIIIEGQLQLQQNLREALNLYGNNFIGKFNYTKYFEFANCDDLIQTLVCCDNESIILGKPRDEINYKYCLVNISPHPVMSQLLSLNVKLMCYHPNKIVNNIAMIIEQYLINNKWHSSCIIANIIFNEELNKLNIKNNINKGFLYQDFNGRKNASWHCWTSIDNIDIDILKKVVIVINSYDECIETFYNKFVLLKNIDETYYRTDKETNEEIEMEKENNILFDMYKNDPENFWNNIKNDKIFNKKYNEVKNNILELRNIIEKYYNL